MPTDAVWIIVTIPKKDFELNVLGKNNNRIRRTNLNIYPPSANQEDGPLEKILDDLLIELGINNVSWVPDKKGDHWHVYFAVDLYDNDLVLSRLQKSGIGTKKETSVGFIPFGLYFSPEEFDELAETKNVFINGKSDGGFKRLQQEFLKSVTSRLTVAQVIEGVRSGASLTFDFLAFTTFAGFIAAAGLLNNSPVDIAAAMMIEPIMATVMAITFGVIVHDKPLAKLGTINLCIVLLICIIIGFLYGIVFFVWSVEWDPPPNGIWPTEEMEVRGTWRALIYGLLQAMAAGGAVAITLLNDAQCALVGVAVASTFLPPHINTGLLWAYACHLEFRGLSQEYVYYNDSGNFELMKPAWIPQSGYKPHYYDDMRYESIALGGVSLLLTYVNVIGMIFVAFIMLWIKQVVPFGKVESNKRFFKEDIKVARHYNRKSGKISMDDNMGHQILREWAEIAGIDPAQLLSQKPEARVTQFQTLKDLINDVENDEVYRSVTKGAIGRPEAGGDLLRRLTFASIHQQQRKPSTGVGVANLGFVDDSELGTSGGKRHYKVTSGKHITNFDNIRAPSINVEDVSEINYRTISSENSITRGMKLEELEQRGKRESLVPLRKQLKESEHSPFSVWPTNSPRTTGRFQVSQVRQRTSIPSRIEREDHRASVFGALFINQQNMDVSRL